MSCDRRQFLGRTAAGAAIISLGGWTSASAASVRRPAAGERILVIVQLSGGNDGLSTVIPYGDDVYGRSRRRTRIDAKDVLRIDEHVGLHPNLKGLRELLDERKLALVQGAGYPNPTRSHFEALDVWHAADPSGRRAGYGWLGRLASSIATPEADPNLVIHIGDRIPFALHSPSHPPVAFATPLAYRWVGADEEAAALERAAPLCEHEPAPADAGKMPEGPNAGRDRALQRLRRVLHEAQASSEQVRKATADYRPRATYPADPFAASLATVSALIAGGLGTRIFSVETSGFDTHTNQRGVHDNLMSRIGNGLTAFLRDLEAHGQAERVCILAFSEFGRRVAENGSGGTDHGVAGPVFVLGSKVRGGLHGEHPSLTRLDRGDLVPTTDFRRIYATLIDRWMGARHREVLGSSFEHLEIV